MTNPQVADPTDLPLIEFPPVKQPDGVQSTVSDDGNTVTEFTFKDGKKNGLARITERGRPTMQMMYVNNVVEGESTFFFPNGKPQMVMTYKGGELHGPFLQYHGNQKIAMKAMYENGLQQGKCLSYSDEGALIQEMSYKDGFLHGPMIMYYQGEVVSQMFYEEGVEIKAAKEE